MRLRILLPATLALAVAVAVASGRADAAPVTATGRPLAPAIGFAPRSTTNLVVWAEDRGRGTGLDLYAARVTSTGIVVGSEIPLVVGPGDQSDPALAYNQRDGDFLVVFTNSGGPNITPTPGVPIPGTPPGGTPPPVPSPPGPPDLFGRWPGGVGPGGPRIQALGATPPPVPTGLATPPPPPPAPTLPTPGNPPGTPPPTALPPLPPPGATATAPSPPATAPGSRDIYGIWVSDGGLALTRSFPMITSPADDTFPSLAYRFTPSQDQWILVWREVTGLDVALRTVELAGFGRIMVYASAVTTIVSGADHGRPSVSGRAAGEFVVVWSQTQTGRVDRDILGRRLNQNGYPYGPLLGIVTSRADQVYPSIGSLMDSGDYLVAWEERSVGAPPDIRVRRLNRNGIPLRAAYDIAGGPPFSFSPNLPSVDRSTLLLVWLDRNPASDHSVMGAELTREGRRIGPERLIVAGGAGIGAVTPAVPPPGFPTMPPLPPPPGFPTLTPRP